MVSEEVVGVERLASVVIDRVQCSSDRLHILVALIRIVTDSSAGSQLLFGERISICTPFPLPYICS